MLIRVLMLAEAIIFLIPISLAWVLGVAVLVGQPTYQAFRRGLLPESGTPVLALWLALCGVGLCALWEVFLRYQTYTPRTIPRRVTIGIVLGALGAIPLCAEGGPGALIALGVPLLLLVQFYYLIRRNGTSRSNETAGKGARESGARQAQGSVNALRYRLITLPALAKVALVVGGYIAAVVVGFAAVWINGVLFILVFGLVSIISTGLALFFLWERRSRSRRLE